jgi:hypothetical protein
MKYLVPPLADYKETIPLGAELVMETRNISPKTLVKIAIEIVLKVHLQI